MVRNIVISCILFFATTALNAQEIENIFTDRPDQSESPVTMYKGFVQFESGIKYTKFQRDTPGESDYSAALPELMIRYGVIKNLELRLNLEYTLEKIYVSGFNPFGSEIFSEKKIITVFSRPN